MIPVITTATTISSHSYITTMVSKNDIFEAFQAADQNLFAYRKIKIIS